MTTTMPQQPYGPNTAPVRRFLVQFAGLGAGARAQVTQAYAAQSATRAWAVAESALAHAIERSGREAQRDALSGPLLQLVQRDVPGPVTEENALDTLDPVAEPALAALLALLVQDLLDRTQRSQLLSPFAGIIDFDDAPPATESVS